MFGILLTLTLSSLGSEVKLVKGRTITGEVSFVSYDKIKVHLQPAGLMILGLREIDSSCYMDLVHEKQMGHVVSNGFLACGIKAESKSFVIVLTPDDFKKIAGTGTNIHDISLHFYYQKNSEITTNDLVDAIEDQIDGLNYKRKLAESTKNNSDYRKAVEADINSRLGKGKDPVDGRAVFAWSENGNVLIVIRVRDNLTSNLIRVGFLMDTWMIIQRLHDKWNYPYDISISGGFPIKDKYGNYPITVVGKIEMRNSEFGKINRESFQAQDLLSFGSWYGLE